MSSRSEWKMRWFGVWRESGKAYGACPAVKDFVAPDALAAYDTERLARYLETAHVVASTSGLQFPCVVCGARQPGALSYRTDGEWLWVDDLGHYIREHGVAPPPAMLKHVAENGYNPPAVTEEQVRHLQWPETMT